MAQVITNKEGTYFADVLSDGSLKTSGGGGGGGGTAQIQGYDGAAWQNLAATNVSGNYALDVNIVAGGDIQIGAVELKDGTTDTRNTISLVNASRAYAPTTDAGFLTAFVDDNGDFNYVIVDSTNNALRTNIYGSVGYNATDNVFQNQIYGYDGTNILPIKTDASGNLLVSVTSGGGVNLTNGQVTVVSAGTRVALGGSTAIGHVVVKANSGNGGNIFVGNNTVTSSNGLILEAGESVDINIDDLADVYVDTDNSGDGVSFIAS